MSKKAKHARAHAESSEEKVRAEAASQALRERRRAATPEPAIDREIHRELPLTRVAMGLLACMFGCFIVSQVAASMGAAEVELIASIATTVLFLVTFVVWFASRHQAKRMTKERREQ